MKPLTFKARTILTFSGITLILTAVLSRVGYVAVRDLYLDQVRDQTTLLMQNIARNMDRQSLAFLNTSGGPSLGADLYRTYLRQQKDHLQLEQLSIVNRDLITVVTTSDEAAEGQREPLFLLHASDLDTLGEGRLFTTTPVRARDGGWYLWSFYGIQDPFVLAVQQSASHFERVDALSKTFWAIGGLGVVLTLAGAFLLVRTLTRPIEGLVRFSRALGQGDWKTPIPAGIKGEFAILVRAMDAMRQGLIQRHQEKETMLAQIAHEIRNPLGSLELMAGLLREDLESHRIDTRHVQVMLGEIAALKSLITQYLNYGRPAPPEPEDVDVHALIREVMRLHENGIRQKSIRVSVNGDLDTLSFDPYHLRQVLTNLIANAIAVLPQEGQIRVRAWRNDDRPCIDVADNGPGIPEPLQEKIFEPFFTTHASGTGLGLAVCRKLCTENQAALRVTCPSSGGSVFRIEKWYA